MTKDEMVGWHHRLNGHVSEQTLGDSRGQGSLVCCSPWGLKDLATNTTKGLGGALESAFQQAVVQPDLGTLAWTVSSKLSFLALRRWQKRSSAGQWGL